MKDDIYDIVVSFQSHNFTEEHAGGRAAFSSLRLCSKSHFVPLFTLFFLVCIAAVLTYILLYVCKNSSVHTACNGTYCCMQYVLYTTGSYHFIHEL